MENELIEEILLILDDKLEKAVSVLKEDFAAVRAGRANPHILDKVTVDYYGAMTPVTQMANVSVQEGRSYAHQRRQGDKARIPRTYRRAPPRPRKAD